MESGGNSNVDFLLTTLNSFEKNISISISQTENKINMFEEQIKELTKPLIKINKKLSNSLKTFVDEFKQIQLRIESKSKFIQDLGQINNNTNQSLSMSLIKEESQLNIQVTQKQSLLVQEIEKIDKGMELLKKMINSKEFQDFGNLCKEPLDTKEEKKDEDSTVSIVSEDDDDKDGKKSDKENLLNKKRSRKNKDQSLAPNSPSAQNRIKQKVSTKKTIDTSNSQNKKIKKRKAHSDKDLLTQLKKKYNTSPYVKKLTKTFISRRLNHKIIYEHKFDYTDNNNEKGYTDERVKSSGDKCAYKYIIFNFKLTSKEKEDELIQKFSDQFKQNYFIKREDNLLTIGGKIKDPLLVVIEESFKKKVLNEKYNVASTTILSYEFYEELANEFDISDPTTKAVFDDVTFNKLMDNWKMLCLVREYVNGVKKRRNILK